MVERVPFVVGNWKMNGTAASLAVIATVADGVAAGRSGRAACAICPPATLIERASRKAAGRLAIGAQDCAVPVSGAHTGDISAEMLADAGAGLVIVGHSERRYDHHESNLLVREKAEAAFRAGLSVILCVGERQNDHGRGAAFDTVAAQLEGSVPPGATPDRFVIAYEPVWAIGTGKTATEEDIADMHTFIRRRLGQRLGEPGAAVRILYGGSVKPDNAAALMAVEDVDGALIGGASLKADDFLAIAGVYR